MRALFLAVLLVAPTAWAADADPFLWLEQVQSDKAMAWVKAHNDRALGTLTRDRRYKTIQAEANAIITAKDRLPYPTIRGGWVYNFWQDADHQRGLWRRVRPEEYAKPQPQWQVLLDIDKLNADEHQDWVFKGAECLPPSGQDCLVSLSHGGKDAVIVREFDVAKATFVADGYSVPEAKTEVSWLDSGRVLIGTDFGPGSMTTSGYPRVVKLWRRGQPLSSAQTLFEGKDTDVSDDASTQFRPEGATTVISQSMTFWTAKHWLLEPDGALQPIPFPDDADFQGAFAGRLLAVLRSDWTVGARTLPAGALVELPLASLWDAHPEAAAQVVYAPDARSSIAAVSTSKDFLYIDALQDVQGRVLRAAPGASGWTLTPLDFPAMGLASLLSDDDFTDAAYLSYESFLVPPSIYAYDPTQEGGKPASLKTLPARFDASDLTVEQLEAVSADGTKVPYFLVHRKDLRADGSHPTLLYGYGGFEVPMTPFYLGDVGKLWSERGEVYALANIRGGGEFGPKWHEAALKEHRQRAFDDFEAVAQDLISRKITSPRRLGIMGGSNGGLLVGTVFTQRPDLFHAVVCQVPLLDMLRYTQIAAGASWIGEYGDPADPKMAEAISKYSPYQNVRKGAHYPSIFFLTSTKDDRVSPVHARKMAAKLESLGDKTLYWENIEGGHGAAADLDERVKMHALEFTYLLQKLVD